MKKKINTTKETKAADKAPATPGADPTQVRAEAVAALLLNHTKGDLTQALVAACKLIVSPSQNNLVVASAVDAAKQATMLRLTALDG